MFVEDYYKRLIKQQCKLPQREIKTDRPWYPKKLNQPETKKEECKFFMLPPNKMVTLLKKHQISAAPNDKIKEFLHKHSLKQIVDFGEVLPNNSDFQIRIPILHSPTPKNNSTGLQLFPIKRKPVKLPYPTIINENKKKSYSISRNNHKLNKQRQSDINKIELYDIIRKLNNSPLHEDTSFVNKKQVYIPDSIEIIPEIKSEIPKSVLPYPPRSKKQLRQLLIRAIKKIKALGLTIRYVMEHKIFSKKPYEKEFSKEFISAVKKNKIEQVDELLQRNPYLVFDYDFYNMTGLHWACKKGHIEIVELLLKYQSDIDGVDILYRTPLQFAIQENNLQIAQMLLSNGAYPWSTAVTDLKSVIDQNEGAKLLITRVRRLQIMAKWTQQRQYLDLI